MNYIEIKHNPFVVDTQFLINSKPPADGCKLSSYKESRLQTWIEKLFDDLCELFNGEDTFRVTFTGVESDYLDLVEAAVAARNQGMQIDLEWIEAEPAEKRLAEIRKLVREASKHEAFVDWLERDADRKKEIDDAFNDDFDVYVVATMSSGKSTLINALLQQDLLPAANEATTATITRISDNKSLGDRFIARRFISADGEVQEVDCDNDAKLESMTEWNKLSDTHRIEIEGNIKAIAQRENVRLVLTDTPGPNNSQDDAHERTTMGFVQDMSRNPLILYVLNASQLGINDDHNLLGLVADAMRQGGKQSRDRFIFALNKMDVLDPEKGELPEEMLERVKTYLVERGIAHPQIFPMSANLARLLRKPAAKHSTREKRELHFMSDLFAEDPRMNMYQYVPLTERVHRTLKNKNLEPVMLASGLPAVEAMIDEYIDKYSLPHRTARAYRVLAETLALAFNETALIAQMDKSERELDRFDNEIQALKARKEKGFDTTTYRDRLEREGLDLPLATVEALTEAEKSANASIQTVSGNFSGTATLEVARKRMDKAEADLRFKFKALINEYENIFTSSQKKIKKNLTQEYKTYVQEIFGDSSSLDLPMLEGIRQSVADIALNLTVEDNEVKTRRVKTGSYEVSTSKWYNPFSWGDTETRSTYEDEEYVDLESIWKARRQAVQTEFRTLRVAAIQRVEGGKTVLLNRFFEFMTREFDGKFDALIISLEEKIQDRGLRQAALDEAREVKAWLDNFQGRLSETVAV